MTSPKKPGVAFWASVIAVVALLYAISFGPACWLTAQPWENGVRNDGWDMPPRWMLIYQPFGMILTKRDSPIKTAVNWWATVGVKPGASTIVPFGLGRYDYVGASRPNAQLK